MTRLPAADLLARKVTELLAEAAFVFAELASEPPTLGAEVVVARLDITHENAAQLCVCAQLDLAQVLAANLLGTDNDTSEAKAAVSDAVGELANILAGTLAVEIFGKDVVARIGIPVVTAEPHYIVDECLAKAGCRVDFRTDEGHGLTVALSTVEP